MADLIINFGKWDPSEIAGTSRNVRILDVQGDAQVTMNRILNLLQG